MFKKWVLALAACALLFLPQPAGAETPQAAAAVDYDSDWHLVTTEEAGHTWELDYAAIMQRGEGRVAGYRETRPDKTYQLTLALFMPDHRMAPIMRLSMKADNTITDRWRAKEEEWTVIQPDTPLARIFDAVWKAKITQTLTKKKKK